ncbi:uncharacterized protein LOC105689782 [Athalia rosae]|uniref:uncharacterized protein LOC105689782 n=1 Tax=Athalia rosae TaxID=37344 RepID=UPI00203429CF|nr:uncharacterized protein LOC105689782 [Athalia rosae]
MIQRSAMNLLNTCAVWFSLVSLVRSSSLVEPPKSAVVVAFENEYELSLLANTLSDNGISTILIISSSPSVILYDTLVNVEIIKLDFDDERSQTREARALNACEALLRNEIVGKKIEEFSPTHVISPALRHDACVLPWAKQFKLIPVVWTQGSEAETYTFYHSGIALPIFRGGFWSRLSHLLEIRSTRINFDNNYVTPALELVGKYLPDIINTLDNFYADVDLVFWGSDPILRSEISPLSQLLVEIGCHHCRGAHPVPADLQKELVEFRLGTIAVLLDEEYKNLIEEIARGLPQGRQGQAVAWKNKKMNYSSDQKPDNLFFHNEVIRQDVIGYPRTRVLLSHCEDTELLEAAFHGTPVICFPRNRDEIKNSQRALSLGFSLETNNDYTASNLLSLIKTIHETAGYRENARKISVAIRDRPNPAADRITYWLGYVARNKNDKKFLAANENRRITYRNIFNVDIWLTIGFIFGVISGAVLPSAYILAGRILAANEHFGGRGKPKRKYKT